MLSKKFTPVVETFCCNKICVQCSSSSSVSPATFGRVDPSSHASRRPSLVNDALSLIEIGKHHLSKFRPAFPSLKGAVESDFPLGQGNVGIGPPVSEVTVEIEPLPVHFLKGAAVVGRDNYRNCRGDPASLLRT